MIDLLKRLLDLVLRFLDWRKSTRHKREANTVRKAVAEHDREELNRILQERRTK